jgi:hypothetical protein
LTELRFPLGGISRASRQAREENLLLLPSATELKRLNEKFRKERVSSYRTQGVAIVPGFMPPGLAFGLESYFRARIAEGFLIRGDDLVPDRFIEYDEELCSYFHHAYVPFVSAIVGTKVKPTNTYYCSYLPGSKLPPHRDRKGCQVTISILLTETPRSWPLAIEKQGARGKFANYSLAHAGDAVIFAGRKLRHSRPRLTGKVPMSSLLLHYVPR